MKKSLKSLQLKKEVISKLEQDKVKGGWHVTAMCYGTIVCITQGALNSCPPPGVHCY